MIGFMTSHRWLLLTTKIKISLSFYSMALLNKFPAIFGAKGYIFNSSSLFNCHLKQVDFGLLPDWKEVTFD